MQICSDPMIINYCSCCSLSISSMASVFGKHNAHVPAFIAKGETMNQCVIICMPPAFWLRPQMLLPPALSAAPSAAAPPHRGIW